MLQHDAQILISIRFDGHRFTLVFIDSFVRGQNSRFTQSTPLYPRVGRSHPIHFRCVHIGAIIDRIGGFVTRVWLREGGPNILI